MTEKITIRRHPDGWHVTRPAFGFAPAGMSTTVYRSGVVALGSLNGPATGGSSGAGVVTGASYWMAPLSWRGYPTRPRWIHAGEGA